MDRHGGKNEARLRLLKEAKEHFHREAERMASILPDMPDRNKCPTEFPNQVGLFHHCLEGIYSTLSMDTRRIARTPDGRLYDGGSTYRSTDDSFTVIIPKPAALFEGLLCARRADEHKSYR